MQVKLVSLTQPTFADCKTPEDLIVYCARVSNPENQTNFETSERLLNYLIKNKHWSPFEQVDMCVEIKTSRAIAAQILRHRSFSFQEFSQRYSVATEIEPIEIRQQAIKNRQSSENIIDPEIRTIDNIPIKASAVIEKVLSLNNQLYKDLIKEGVSKETARMVLPLSTQTTLYMKGSIRSWLTYLNLRLHKHTQKEHRLIAEEVRNLMVVNFPIISKSFNNFETASEEHFIN